MNRAVSYVVGVALFATLLPSLYAQRGLRDIPDPDADLELAELEVAPEFEINLFASDPQIAKPVQMNFDAAGRLWVASSEVYPQIKPGQEADDKIVVLEDQDRDGVAESTTVFARGLLIPTGVAPGDGGVYVANSTELLHLADRDGDGVADTERVVLSGFGTEDTHHILHTLRWGPDGLLYMNQSIYIHSHIETPYGVRRMNGGGIWHFRPETMELETYTLGLVNTWGHAFDEYGQSMATDGAGGEGINYVFPGFVGVTSPGAKRILHGLNPGKPKLCGLEVIGGSHLPPSWRGSLIANDFRAHRVCRYVLANDGAGYASRELDELVKTRHQAFRPIDVKLGPDGAIYIADWYNPIIQHGEVDFRDPRRDHTHGRIWRITAKGRPLLPRRNLYRESIAALLDVLRSDEPYWRQQAKRVLKERGAHEVESELAELDVRDWSDRAKLELLWVYQAIDVVEPRLVRALLAADDGRIRAAATRVLYHWQGRMPNHLQLLAAAAVDAHPRVRMEAAHALRRSGESQAIVLALAGISQDTDRFLEFALQQTADQTQADWLPALRKGSLDFGKNSAGLVFALQAAGTADAVPLLLESTASWRTDAKAMRDVMALVASRGNAQQMQRVLAMVLDQEASSELRVALLNALISAARVRKVWPAAERDGIRALWQNPRPEVRGAAFELAGLWKLADVGQRLSAAAAQEDDASARAAAIRGLVALPAVDRLRTLTAVDQPRELQLAALVGMVSLDAGMAAERAVPLLGGFESDGDPRELINAFLAVKHGQSALAKALATQQGTIDRDVAKLCVRAATGSGRDLPELIEQFRRTGGLREVQMISAGERGKLLVDAQRSGDPAAGEAIYRRKQLNCLGCHAIGGAGGRVGPDLASIGASAPADYILEALLDPAAKIKENYHSLVVATDEGQVLTGVKLRETEDSLILRTAQDKEIVIPLAAIEARRDGGSLMPAGLIDDLTRQELMDLLRFLTELGKLGDYALPKQAFVRSWETLAADVNRGALKRHGEPAVPVDERFRWEPVFSTVQGGVPVNELPSHEVPFQNARVKYLRVPLNLKKSGTPILRLARTEGVRVFLNDQRVDTEATMRLSLPAGDNWITLALDEVDAEDVSIDLRLE